ncbi:IucA/IucC family protein [Nocardia arthritidis]|uniref:Siderophore biosynthesis protein n=1 Tax=Nocardia arthritidis TaxID=228602 RepID=A0A6G9YLJ0_9NOCA|nr:IucA/IucC family protein [Nocardia arthritidis]QIS14074.1 siderophore biosynthesis protein [Nocardia arthritidis]
MSERSGRSKGAAEPLGHAGVERTIGPAGHCPVIPEPRASGEQTGERTDGSGRVAHGGAVGDRTIDRETAADPLDDPDPVRAADAAATEALLRCYVREFGVAVPSAGRLELELAATGLRLCVPVLYRSATGWHRFGVVRLADGQRADVALVAAAVIREATRRLGGAPHTGAAAVARVLDSAQRIAAHLSERRARPGASAGQPEFLTVEQALLLGHPFHPVAKSRPEASQAELAAYSPELRGSFALHWFAAHADLVIGDSATSEPVWQTVRRLFGAGEVPANFVPVPAHPWQARQLLGTPAVGRLLDSGMLCDLGPVGAHWYPTSSVRTVYRDGAVAMLKLSLGMRITNSRRNNKRDELALGVTAARLLDAGLSADLRRAHPDFHILRDPAWISVDVPGVPGESGFEIAVRDNPSGRFGRAVCIAGLVAEQPGIGAARLADIIGALAARGGKTVAQASIEWFGRYLDVVATPLLWLYARHGLALEAHHQNTLVELDTDGWPVGGWYRDSQGYYVAASHADRTAAILPGFDCAPIVFDDALVDERITYYLLVNNLLGLIGAFGALRLADERALLARLRETLTAATGPAVVESWLDAPELPCKANFLTSVDGRDELDGPVHNQSIYLRIPNPVADIRG